jgi:hypothetical protein
MDRDLLKAIYEVLRKQAEERKHASRHRGSRRA